MSNDVLTFKDTKTKKRLAFNPVLITSIAEHHNIDGAIIITLMADSEGFIINYPYDEAVKRWGANF